MFESASPYVYSSLDFTVCNTVRQLYCHMYGRYGTVSGRACPLDASEGVLAFFLLSLLGFETVLQHGCHPFAKGRRSQATVAPARLASTVDTAHACRPGPPAAANKRRVLQREALCQLQLSLRFIKVSAAQVY